MSAEWATPFDLSRSEVEELVALIGERTGSEAQRQQFAKAVGAVLRRTQSRLFMPDISGQAVDMHKGATGVLEAFNDEAADLSDSEAATLRALLHKVAENTAEAGTMERRGRSKKDTATLAELAQVWRFAFGVWPNAKPSGPFMRVVRWINERYADLPTGNAAEPYIGKGTK